ncbi:hypothetical protein U9Z90_22400 [Escherichia fergusonii]
MGMLIELTTIGVQSAEDTNLHALFVGPPEHSSGGGLKELAEQEPVVVEKGPKQMGYGEGDMLPVAVWQNVALL